MPTIGPMELAVVLVIALLILGPRKLPEAGRSLGRGIREFKDSLTPSSDRADEVRDSSQQATDVRPGGGA
jgi:sec-independent protein translocase protein TatA